MTLAPESRVLLTDALRPPPGSTVDIAVGTTYSMDLNALLLVPFTFALGERIDEGATEDVDPVRLLEALRRYADRTTVFVQAGGIGVPKYRALLPFVEESIYEATAPTERAIFHPKVWALRFVDAEGTLAHRCVVLSRNLTFDHSWDTALVLDEAAEGAIEAAPLAAFLRSLSDRATTPVASARAASIQDLTRGLVGVKFAAPAPFTGGELLPIGLDGEPHWPFPQHSERVLAISPFLSAPAIATLASQTTGRVLLSRAESLDLLGANATAGWETHVLAREAEPEAPDADAPSARALDVRDGLHAKTYILDVKGGQSLVVTGSANLTATPWGGNVEFGARLSGPTSEVGVQRTLHGSDGAPGLDRVLESYVPSTRDGIPDASIATSYAIERFHQQLAVLNPIVDVALVDDTAELTWKLSALPSGPGFTRAWPASTQPAAHAHRLEPMVSWTVDRQNVTPFVVIETTAGEGDARAVVRCVLKAALTGDINGRRDEATQTVLRKWEDVLRYVVFLLGDDTAEALLQHMANDGSGDQPARFAGGSNPTFALFEPLVRALGHDSATLAQVHKLIAEVRGFESSEDLIPSEFDQLWDAVWAVHEEGKS